MFWLSRISAGRSAVLWGLSRLVLNAKRQGNTRKAKRCLDSAHRWLLRAGPPIKCLHDIKSTLCIVPGAHGQPVMQEIIRELYIPLPIFSHVRALQRNTTNPRPVPGRCLPLGKFTDCKKRSASLLRSYPRASFHSFPGFPSVASVRET